MTSCVGIYLPFLKWFNHCWEWLNQFSGQSSQHAHESVPPEVGGIYAQRLHGDGRQPMTRGTSIVLGAGLIIVWLVGLGNGATSWLTWLDGVAALCAFGGAG